MRKLNSSKTTCIVIAFCVAAAMPLTAQSVTNLASFDTTNGAQPNGIVQGTDGNLYRTTYNGGTYGNGTLFKITTGGTLTRLHSFKGSDGANPSGGVVQAADGNFYGTTSAGGTNGDGTVFKITTGGTLTTLHSFTGSDGSASFGSLIQTADGSLYGTTSAGGTDNKGTVFKITTGGTLTTLHSFDGTDGFWPQAGLVQATDGNLYGSTGYGTPLGDGTIFKITTGGTLTTLHSFDGTDGAEPNAPLVQASDGNLYGTTYLGGAHSDGTVFKITTDGTLTNLYSFCSHTFCEDGHLPLTIVQGTDGNLYGATVDGGITLTCDAPYGCGTLFEITTAGTMTTLYEFELSVGQWPGYGLIQDTNGKFYGTSLWGGAYGEGTFFSLNVGLAPFVETEPTSGTVGATVVILGNKLKSATSVSFNGAPATFTVVSGTEITTTVPTGATTGTVTVVTSSGTLSSNVAFQITP